MSSIKQYSKREVMRILKNNGFILIRNSGDHRIYKNDKGYHISIPEGEPNKMLIRRLIKENNLEV